MRAVPCQRQSNTLPSNGYGVGRAFSPSIWCLLLLLLLLLLLSPPLLGHPLRHQTTAVKGGGAGPRARKGWGLCVDGRPGSVRAVSRHVTTHKTSVSRARDAGGGGVTAAATLAIASIRHARLCWPDD